MKKYIITVAVLLIVNYVNAQTPNAHALAQHIAKKMKDSLSLTESQRIQIRDINLQIHNDKAAMRQLYSGTDSLRIKIQSVENSRDALYQPVLGEVKYALYLQKKRYLVTSN